jgi:hypothetical protein
MSTFAPFIAAVRDRIVANSSYVTDAANTLLTNNIDIATAPDTAFPRVEIYVDMAKAEGYESQRDLQWCYRFWFNGYLKRTVAQDNSNSLWTETDFLSIWDFGEETMASVLGILDACQVNPSLAPDFLMFKGSPILTASCEIIPNISTFMGFVEAIFQKEDTNG